MTDATIQPNEPVQTSRVHLGRYLLGTIMAASSVTGVIAIDMARTAGERLERMGAQIVLTDESGRPRVRMAVEADGGRIEVLDERGVARISLHQQHDDDAVLSMHRRKEQGDAAQMEQSPTLQLHGHAGYISVRGELEEWASIDLHGALGAFSSGGSAMLGSSRGHGPHMSLIAERAGRDPSFKVEFDSSVYLSGSGKLVNLHDAFVKDLVWRVSRTHIDPDAPR